VETIGRTFRAWPVTVGFVVVQLLYVIGTGIDGDSLHPVLRVPWRLVLIPGYLLLIASSLIVRGGDYWSRFLILLVCAAAVDLMRRRLATE